MNGTVRKWFDRGFGFIDPDSGGDSVFAHISNVDDDVDDLPEGARVSFTIGPGRNDRTEAKTIRICTEGNR